MIEVCSQAGIFVGRGNRQNSLRTSLFQGKGLTLKTKIDLPHRILYQSQRQTRGNMTTYTEFIFVWLVNVFQTESCPDGK